MARSDGQLEATPAAEFWVNGLAKTNSSTAKIRPYARSADRTALSADGAVFDNGVSAAALGRWALPEQIPLDPAQRRGPL